MRFVELKCKNCGEVRYTHTDSDYYKVDCDCTLIATGGTYRTSN